MPRKAKSFCLANEEMLGTVAEFAVLAKLNLALRTSDAPDEGRELLLVKDRE